MSGENAAVFGTLHGRRASMEVAVDRLTAAEAFRARGCLAS